MGQKGLGAGLGALLGGDAAEGNVGGLYLPVSKIEPRAGQPRTRFDEAALAELAESIREHGLIQPVTVRPLGDGYYQLIAGERRWRAARLAGLTEVPARILEAGDRETAELALVENLQREDLNPVEEARGYRSLMDSYGLTQEAAAERVGKSRPVVANSLRLLGLPGDALARVEDGTLSLSQARAILEAPDATTRSAAAKEAAERGLTVRETAALVKRLAAGKKAAKRKSPASPDGVDYMAEVEKDLTRTLGRRVRIAGGARKGRFELEYYGREDFETLRKALLEIRKGGGD